MIANNNSQPTAITSSVMICVENYKLLVYSNKAWAVFIPRDGRVPRPLQAEHVWRARHSGEAAADNLATREAAQQTATVTGAQTAECE